MEVVLKLVVIVAQHNEYTKNQSQKYFNMANFMFYQLYLNKKEKMTLTRQISIKGNNHSLLLKNKYSSREISNPCQNMTKGRNDKRGPL